MASYFLLGGLQENQEILSHYGVHLNHLGSIAKFPVSQRHSSASRTIKETNSAAENNLNNAPYTYPPE